MIKIFSYDDWSIQIKDDCSFADISLEYDHDSNRVSFIIDISFFDALGSKDEPFFYKNMSSDDLKKLSDVALKLSKAVEETEKNLGLWED